MCPPGVDQTMRTVARWQILALETKHRQETANPHTFIANGDSMDAFRRLYRLDRAQSAFCHNRAFAHGSPVEGGSQVICSPTSRLESMPPEILSMITSYILPSSDASTNGLRPSEPEVYVEEDGLEEWDPDVEKDVQLPSVPSIPSTPEFTLIALALCSRTLWYHVSDLVYTLCNPREGIWAGRTLICTSTWLEDVPDGVHKVYPDLKGHCEQWSARIEQGRGMGRRGFGPGMNPVRRWNWDAYSSWKYPGNDAIEKKLREAFTKNAKLEARGGFKTKEVLVRLHKAFEGLVGPQMSLWEVDEKQSWMLRNLDSEEYVRLDLIDQPDPETDGLAAPVQRPPESAEQGDDSAYVSGESSEPDDSVADDDSQEHGQSSTSVHEKSRKKILAVAGLPWLTVDAVLISRISWGIQNSFYQGKADGRRGPWAGNRFEIVRAPNGDTPGNDDGHKNNWTDVTELVVKEIKKLRDLPNHHDRVNERLRSIR